nr:PREDICTED: glycine-rich domain-containing protein 1-like isoform X1 [Daucus carota subsp. sativus]XP_017218220.1 PREDICTED: glycine-rich domain-containing protein 1-like isoform X1 [Daucus carota subsp. sativus]
MEKNQEIEWSKAQQIVISEDLVATAKQQLLFLAAVDRNRWLYKGPALQRSIYRYNACWLPLLAKNAESQISKGPLVVPLDCEWVWHCHRLNPVRYISDCKKFYGRILDNCNVASSIQGASGSETEEIWERLYPDEPYSFQPDTSCWDETLEKAADAEKHTTYDLVLAIERQSPFFYQVSRPHMKNDLFLEGAVARYKGFLHLIKKNREHMLKRFCVPTYDIDLIWHSHQLHPVSYCKDLVKLIGKVLEHDDTDSDRTKGQKLDVGFSETTSQWEQTFGSRYWRSGSMYRGAAPSPLITIPFMSKSMTNKIVATDVQQQIISLPELKSVEVMLEFVDIKNLPEGLKGSVYVSFSKAQPDAIFNTKRKLNILSEYGEKQVALFNCEPSGLLLFEVLVHSNSNLAISKPKALGSATISLEDFLVPVSSLSVEKWLEVVPPSGLVSANPISIRAALSFNIPSPATHVLHIVRSRPFLKGSCFSPLPEVQFAKSWTHISDENGNKLISLQMRDNRKLKRADNELLKKEVIGITESGETRTLAKLVGTKWSLIDSSWSVRILTSVDIGVPFFELTGHRTVRYFPGRKLEYEPKHCEKSRSDLDFLTAVQFSAEDPYGRAVALLDLKYGIYKVQEDWFVIPGIILGFIYSETLRKKGYSGLANFASENPKEGALIQGVNTCDEKEQKTDFCGEEKGSELIPEGAEGNAVAPLIGGCGNCGSECGNVTRTVDFGGCGSGCGGECGNMLKSGGCGGCGGSSGCGGCGGSGGCGNMVKSGGCGGCGGGCGGCGGGCGNMAASGGCGGGCGSCGGGGCGNRLAPASIDGNQANMQCEAIMAYLFSHLR